MSKSKDNKWRFISDKAKGRPLPPPPPSPRISALWQGLGSRSPPTTAPQHTHQHRTGPPHSQANTGSGPPPPPPSMSRHCGRGWGHSHLRGERSEVGGRGAQLCSQPSSPDCLILGAITASSVFPLKPEFWVSPLVTAPYFSTGSVLCWSLSCLPVWAVSGTKGMCPGKQSGYNSTKGKDIGLSVMHPGLSPSF